MKKILFTTVKDTSAEYFKKYGWDVFLYDSLLSFDNDYDVVYFRDPFNDPDFSYNSEVIDSLIKKFGGVRSIDNIRSFDDIYLSEDKWSQAQKYVNYMPKTYLPSESEFTVDKMIAKKRISQRAKDIKFEIDKIINDDWIFQDLLDIKEELRVYCVFGEVIPEATIKTSKMNGKVKIVDARLLTPVEIDFCKGIAEKTNLDFIGLDIASTKNGDLQLIEVNRSPQFNRFVDCYGDGPLNRILDLV